MSCRRPHRVVAALVALGCVAAAPTGGNPGPEAGGVAAGALAAERARDARSVPQREPAARAEAAAVAARLAGERVAAAARLRGAEEAAGDAAGRVSGIAARMRESQARLAQRELAFRPLLPLLERLSIYPAETLIAMPVPPEQALRGVLVLGGISRQLETEAAALRAEQAQLRGLGERMRAELPRLAAAQAVQAREAAELDRQVEAARATEAAAEDAATAAARRGAGEAARAEGLRAAIARIDAERQAAEAQARAAADAAARARRAGDAAEARQRQAALARPAGPGLGGDGAGGGGAIGGLTSPVAGSIVKGFGAATDAGPANGMSYQAPPAARVVSPCDGRIVFSGPFRSYGKLLIVDCGGGYHVVLAGLDRLDALAGQPVRTGEPVGVMPGWDPRAGGGRPELYVELRRAGDPVNPAPFLRAKS